MARQPRSSVVQTYALYVYANGVRSCFMAITPMTVVEMETFLQRAKAILTEPKRADLIAYLASLAKLASNPKAGQLVPGTGGVPGKFDQEIGPIGSRQAQPEAASCTDPLAIPEKEMTVTRKRPATKHTTAGRRLIASAKQALAWAKGENVRGVRVTVVEVNRAPLIDVRSVRQKLGLSQSQFAARFGFTAATVGNWEQGRTQPDGPARILLAVIAHHPDAVEDALRKVS